MENPDPLLIVKEIESFLLESDTPPSPSRKEGFDRLCSDLTHFIDTPSRKARSKSKWRKKLMPKLYFTLAILISFLAGSVLGFIWEKKELPATPPLHEFVEKVELLIQELQQIKTAFESTPIEEGIVIDPIPDPSEVEVMAPETIT